VLGPRVGLSEALEGLRPRGQRVLIWDLESSPHLAWTFDVWDATIAPVNIVERSRVLCFAAKWHGESKVVFRSEFHDGRAAMLAEAWRLLDEADVVVGYNHVRFDVPVMQREFLLEGLGPPSPWVDVDLLRVVKRRFRFASNRLGEVCKELGLDHKLETGGQQLWQRVLAGDEKAWRLFRRYNINDVKITEQLLDRVGPWSPRPHPGHWNGSLDTCWACGGTDITTAGWTYYGGVKAPVVRCTCGATSRLGADGTPKPV